MAVPGTRPPGRPAGTQSWRDLAFVHWEIAPGALEPLLPDGLKVDLYKGRTYAGVVPFAMRAVRARWMPRRLGLDFFETNVRCYVRCRGEPGIYFFSLDASSRLAVAVARLTWGLPYHHAGMSLERASGEIRAASTRRDSSAASLHLRYRVGRPLGPSEPGSLEHFLLERYVLFARKRGVLIRGQVHHQPYPAHAAELLEIDQTLLGAADLEPGGPVAALHYAPGVDVEVFTPRPALPASQ